MGRRLRTQRAGKGTSTYKAAKGKTVATYGSLTGKELERGQVVSFFTDPIRSGIIAEILMENQERKNMVAAEGLMRNQRVDFGKNAEVVIGNVLPLEKIPEGCPIFAIERIPGDGGVMVKASGLYALVMTKDSNSAFVKLPSGKTIKLSSQCMAAIGCCAGGGRTDKPFVKAGNRFFAKKARHQKYPTVRGVAMNANEHPFGGSGHHAGKSKSTKRTAPPGRKVGAIASKRTGRLKK